MTTTLRRLSDLPFPGWKHQPGHPDKQPQKVADSLTLVQAKQAIPAAYIAFVPAGDAGFLYGIDLHDHGYFWEAHEIWEAVWMRAPKNGCDRLALRALIQITNACLKQITGKPKARDRLLCEALGLIKELTMRKLSGPESHTAASHSLSDAINWVPLAEAVSARIPVDGEPGKGLRDGLPLKDCLTKTL